MKAKTIFTLALAVIFTAGISSCQDMLKVDSKTYDYGHEMTAQDTVYSVMGIIQKIQEIADRTVLLGEIRGDLVTLTGNQTPEITELYNYDFANLSADNKYNRPIDYYAVINNCNYFLANVDTSLYSNGKNVFLKEYIPVLCYRAWTYLQMAQIYGRVYYVNEPITSGDEATSGKFRLMDIKTLAKELLVEFEQNENKYPDYKLLNYGSLGGSDNDEGSKSQKHNSQDLLIPVRLIMGDLYLWSEQFEKAAKYYHDYLYYNNQADILRNISTGTGMILWNGTTFTKLGEDSYASNFGTNAKPITYIPMASEEYAGITSKLPDIFNSTEENRYYPQLTYSKAMSSLSQRQVYCYHDIIPLTGVSVAEYMSDPVGMQVNPLLRGDLRLQSIFEVKARDSKDIKSLLENTAKQTLKKINSEKISLYRNDVVYLRLAEALNRAGLPNMAFAVLKNGLTESFIVDRINLEEQDKATALGIAFPLNYFDSVRYQIVTDQININNDPNNPSAADYVRPVSNTNNSSRGVNMGIHSRGSGDAAMNKYYTISLDPSASVGNSLIDTIRRVEEMILDEMALETCFEGYRFGDLMRISMHRAYDKAEYDPTKPDLSQEQIKFDKAFFADRVASRDDATPTNPFAGRNSDLYNTLKGDDGDEDLFPQSWFLRLNTSVYY